LFENWLSNKNPFYLSTLEKEGQAKAQVRQAVPTFSPMSVLRGLIFWIKKSLRSKFLP